MPDAARICLYEREPEALSPLSDLRPVWDLRPGTLTLEDRLDHLVPDIPRRYAGRVVLDAWWRARTTHSLVEPVPADGTLFLDGGLALGPAAFQTLLARTPPYRIEVGGRCAGAFLTEGGALPGGVVLAPELDTRSGNLPVVSLEQPLIRTLTDPIRHQESLIVEEATLLGATGGTPTAGPGVIVLGDGPLLVEPGAIIDPGTTLDTRGGPIAIRARARVSLGTWLLGPAVVGTGTHLLGGTIGPLVGIGPTCRVRGELAESFLHGFSNKAHDGFIGHSVIGEWVNLGALTTCSDLKNNYSEIRLEVEGRTRDTGLTKLGVVLGDHVKTAIGTLLSTGTVVGTGASVFGTVGLSPKYVPPFSWGTHPEGKRSYDLERFLETARRVLGRRDVTWSDAYEQLIRHHYERC